MLNAADNETLTRTGADTAMGKLFRRFWVPVALSRELPESDGAPIRVTIMGESLIAFRDTNGRVGLIEPRCPHRGADLYYGRNEDCGIRCVYHGWKFDVEGNCLERPNVPLEKDTFRDRIRIKAYPTREFGEIVWAYLGPAGDLPPIPELEFGLVPASHRYVTKKLQQCNWAQCVEGGLDTAHVSFLHMPAPVEDGVRDLPLPADERRLRWIRDDPAPRLEIVEHDVGFVVGGARKADAGTSYWRISQFMLPSHSSTPAAFPGENYYGYTWIPISDEACWMYTYVWNPDRALTDAERRKFDAGFNVVTAVDDRFIPLRNRDNDYLIDRAEQKTVSYTGVRGVAEQDAMIQESLGLIADRTKEHLTATDIAVVKFRRVILAAARALQEGREPPAARNAKAYRLRSGSWMAETTAAFEDVMNERFGHPLGQVL
jgi:phenylpropionate dioxygenase-like ring-hydroxylating dioxygenase large terminal subunit